MIVIFSNNADISTYKVANWLLFYRQRFLRINNSLEMIDKISGYCFFSHKDPNENDAKIKSVWFRKKGGGLKETTHKISLSSEIELATYLKWESDSLIQGVFDILSDRFSLGSHKGDINKLFALKVASQCGLLIPETIISTKKNEILDFAEKHQKIILKPISNSFSFSFQNKLWNMYNTLLMTADIAQLPDSFLPALFQEYISKEFELRIFYLNGKLFPAAIFTQQTDGAEIDSRRQKDNNLSRVVPYKLPLVLEKKLISFMNEVKLNTGSIDMIKTVSGQYFFLEVNMAGQFDWVSECCNFNLEQKIAKCLMN